MRVVSKVGRTVEQWVVPREKQTDDELAVESVATKVEKKAAMKVDEMVGV